MKISAYSQGSIEWLNARKGIPTASEFAPFMVKCTTETEKSARFKYICGKVTENFENDEFEQAAQEKQDRFFEYDPWIQRGKALEPVARKALSKRLGAEIVETGLVFHDSGDFAASPDGLVVGADGDEWGAGCEIKCHNRVRHLADLLIGKLPKDHLFQCHGGMAVTGLRVWHYFAYYPSQPPLHIVVERDAFTEQLLAGLKELVAEKTRIKSILRELWSKEFRESVE